MKSETYREVTQIGDRLMGIVEELCGLLRQENIFIQSANDTCDAEYEALVNRKQSLSNDYYLACKSLHELPADLKQGLEGYMLTAKEKLDQFVSLLNENKELLAARYSRSERRVEAIMAAIDAVEQTDTPYRAEGVIARQQPATHLQDLQA